MVQTNEYWRAWRAANKEKISTYNREQYAKNSEVRKSNRHAAYAANPEYDRERQKTYRGTITGRARRMLTDARKRAAKSNLPFELTLEWLLPILEEGKCAATGVSFVFTPEPNFAWSPSLDQITPGGGYTPENVQVVCWSYNAAKGSNTDADVLIMARALVAKNSC